MQQRPVSTFLPRHLGPRGATHPGPLHTTGTETFLGVFKDLRRKEKMGANKYHSRIDLCRLVVPVSWCVIFDCLGVFETLCGIESVSGLVFPVSYQEAE